MDPKARRPLFPKEYGVEEEGDLLDWTYVEERMSEAKHYWLSTVSPTGAPHTRPIAGMWLGRKLYFGGSPDSRWLRNLGENPRVCLNLSEEADQAVILHGGVTFERPDHDLATQLVEVSNAKYAYGQNVADYEGQVICVLEPKVVYAWKELKDATRWRFS